MTVLRAIAVAFAQYSRIPMPRFEWKEKDMCYSIAAFPLVGAVIGLLFYGLFRGAVYLELPDAATALLLTAVPLIVTGGFHVDGFMDVSDALSSFKTREEKLAILKDPHIGAFAVIRLAVCGLIYIGALIIVLNNSMMADGLMIGISAGFAISRCLSALSVLTFRSAKKEGMLYYEATSAAGGRRANLIIVLVLALISAWVMAYCAWPAGGLLAIAPAFSFIWYKYLSYKELGGITGDTAGYFVVVCETAIAAAAAAGAVMLQIHWPAL